MIDIDGVLVVSWRALDGAVGALQRVRSAGIPLRMLTNTTSRTRAGVVARLRDAGFDIDEEEVVTAPIATAEYLRTRFPDGSVALLSSGDVTGDLAAAGADLIDLTDPATPAPERVDAVVLGGAGPEFTYEALDRAFDLLLGGAELVAMHRGLTWRTARGIQLDTGAFLAGLERAAGVRATVVGKPEPAMFAAGLASLGAAPAEVVMIGDDLDGDVRGAQHSGIAGILVRTGKFRPAALQTPGRGPDLVADDFASAIAALGISG